MRTLFWNSNFINTFALHGRVLTLNSRVVDIARTPCNTDDNSKKRDISFNRTQAIFEGS